MAFFKSKTLSQSIDTARANRDRLAARLVAAEQSVIDAKSAAQRAALDGDDGAQDAAEIAEGTALRRLSTTKAAHSEATTLVTKLEAEQAALIDKRARAATATQVAELASSLEANGLELRTALEKAAALTKRAALFTPEAVGVNAFAESSALQIAPAFDLVTMLMRNYAGAVLDGSAPSALPTPERPFTPTIVPKPVVRRLFALRAVSWTDADGMLRVTQKYTDADLPLDAADRAIAAKVCVEMDDPARKSNHNQWPGHPDPALCYSLDGPGATVSEPAAAGNEPIQFQPVDRGPAYQLRIATGGAS